MYTGEHRVSVRLTHGTHLFIPDVFSRVSSRLLHGRETHHLEEVVLHHVSDDPKLVKVSASTLGAKRLLEGDGHTSNVVAVPDWLEGSIGKSRGE